MTIKKDYYEILGVGRDSSSAEIKKAYRSLALQYHPDRVAPEKKKESGEKFKEISEAYAVLSDTNKRNQYNQFGHAGIDGRYSSEDIFRSADFSSVFGDVDLGGIFGTGTTPRVTIVLNDGKKIKIHARVFAKKGVKSKVGFFSGKSDAFNEIITLFRKYLA